jgi:hypothetical protein
MSLLNLIKTVYRLLRYKAEWKKQFREVDIRKIQNASIRKIDPKTEKIILFFIPGADYYSGKESISGGLISIISLAQETSLIYKETSVQVLCATYYKEHLIFKLSSFINETQVFSPVQIENYFSNVDELILHIPELYVADFVQNHQQNSWFKGISSIQINILNQNIQLMPDNNVLNELKSKFTNCTTTTAHKKYCNPYYRKLYGIPLHLLSVWISPENYVKKSVSEKDNLILFSPDNNELNQRLISFFSKEFPYFKLQVIKGLTYEEYKRLISRAKYLITTGEGLDAYFIETYFSGGVAFALKNMNFFDEKYLDLPCLFENQVNLEKLLLNLLEHYNIEEEYNVLNKKVGDLLSEDYSNKSYQHNLRKFYNKEYTYA